MKNIIHPLKTLVLALIIGFGASYAFAAWTNPTCDPNIDPGACNAQEPVTVGSTGGSGANSQYKSDSLGIGGILRTYNETNIAIDGGGVGIGTNNPQFGKVQISAYGTPLVFQEKDYTGVGALWRTRLNNGDLGFEVSSNGTDFASTKKAIKMTSGGDVEIGANDVASSLPAWGEEVKLKVDGATYLKGTVIVGNPNSGLNASVLNDIGKTGDFSTNGDMWVGGQIEAPDGTICDKNGCIGSGGASNLWTSSGSDIYYDAGNVGIGTVTPTWGKMQIDSAAIPLAFRETDQTGAGSLWRMPLDGKSLRFDASQNGTDFAGYKRVFSMNAAGDVRVGNDLLVDGNVDMGWERRTSTCTACNSRTATCTSGKKIIGGGCINYNFDSDTTTIRENGPITEDSWKCLLSDDAALVAYAICANIQ